MLHNYSKMSTNRELVIDFFRGIIIINMIFIHYSRFFQDFLRKMINFGDIAIEGFIFLAGFMIGRHYLEKFMVNKKEVTKRLLLRSIKLVFIQYIMIMTISLPFYSCFRFTSEHEILKFIISSFLFLNQIPILHILPTFIPLLIISPILLVILAKNWDYWLIFFSIILFLVGWNNPYIFNVGERTIFPFVLWQIYFVLGSFIGKCSNTMRNINNNRLLIYSVILYSIAFFMKYGGYFNEIHVIKVTYNIYPKKFPLNLYGFLYGCSSLLLFYTVIIKLWGILTRYRLFSKIIPLLGRYSLTTFMIHAYFVYLFESLVRIPLNKYIIYFLLISSFYFIFKIIYQIDKENKNNRLPPLFKWLLC